MKAKRVLMGSIVFLFCSAVNATSDEWSKGWAISESRFGSNITQANLIKLEDSDYYNGLGRNSVYSTYTTYIDQQENTTSIGQYTSAIGATNSSTNNININGSNNSTSVSNGATTTDSEVKSGIQVSSQSGSSSQCINLSAQQGGTSSC